MTVNKTLQNEDSVTEFVNSLNDEHVSNDCQQLIEVMTRISGHKPKMWGPSIIGFDSYHYVYASGREGDAAVIAFSPRKGKIAIYLDAEAQSRDKPLFDALGSYTSSKVCVYVKKLSDIHIDVLEKIIASSYAHVSSLAPNEHA